MPVPASEIPQWVINLSIIGGGVAAAITGVMVKRRESRFEKPEPGAVSVVGGALIDGRVIDRLTDALGHSERATHSGERAIMSLSAEIGRLHETAADIRTALDARNAAYEAEQSRMMRAIEKGKSQ